MAWVNYPSLPSSPEYEKAKKYMQEVISRGDDETLAKAAQDLLDMYEEAEKAAGVQPDTE